MTPNNDAPTRPIRLCIALPGLHRVNRGAEVVLEEIARHAARDGRFDITLIGSGQPRPDQPYRFIHSGCISREKFEKFPKIPYARDHYAWEELSFAPGLYFKYKPRQYDLTLTCGYPYSNWILRKGRKHQQPKHIFVTQNGDWMVQAKNAEFKYFNCDGLICTNPEYYQRHKDTRHATLIPNGVDVSLFHPGEKNRAAFNLPENARIILVVAALIPSKRVLNAVQAASTIPDAFLVIAGDGEQRTEVDQLCQKLMPGRFLRSTFPRQSMPDLYRTADVLLHMSQDEPFGNIYIEAMASGLPVVAHNSPVTQWIVQNHAFLVDTSLEQPVTEALRNALSQGDPDQIARRVESTQTRFSWESVSKRYCEFFTDVVNAG